MNHRGRFQAQGVALEESESWSQMEALYYEEGRALLKNLEAKLSKKDRLMRTLGFQQCYKCIERASQNGGICVKDMGRPFIKSFPKNYKERVDLEVRLGIAFIIKPKEKHDGV